MKSNPRIALFTHDTFGLGHVQRCLHLARALSHKRPAASILLITGSPALGAFGKLPPNVDVVKIPTVVKTGAPGNQPPHLRLSNLEMRQLRQNLIRETVLSFDPDVFIVDNFPLGSQGELLPLLQELKRRDTRTLLGLRDILDTPASTIRDFERQGLYDVLEHYYDRVLIYGMRSVFDLTRKYRFPSKVARRARYCGYLTDPALPLPIPVSVLGKLGLSRPWVLASGGGGGDAYPLLSVFIQAMGLVPDVSALVFTGPLMGAEDRARLEAQAKGVPRIKLLEFTPDFRRYLRAASATVSMCGYNSAAEVVLVGKPAIMVPRTWKYGEHKAGVKAGMEGEQVLRAKALSRLGHVRMIEPGKLTADVLARSIRQVLRPRSRKARRIPVRGLAEATRQILNLLGDAS